MPEASRGLATAIADLARDLRAARIEQAEADARHLVLAAAGLGRIDLVRDPRRALDGEAERRLATFRNRRLGREPVSRILGRRAFWSLELEVTPDVLDPRPETELLVETALDHLRRRGCDHSPVTILDLGTGSGAILIALLRELPAALGVGVDLSLSAAQVAQRNAVRHGVAGRAMFVVGDWAGAVGGPVDLIVSNPPYLKTLELESVEPEVRDYDPSSALDGGPDGLTAYRALVAAWQRLERPTLVLEIGAMQAHDVVEILHASAFDPSETSISVGTDLAGRPRVVAAMQQIRFP